MSHRLLLTLLSMHCFAHPVTRLSLTKGALAYLVWYYPNYICRGNLVIRLSCLGGHMIESAVLRLLITLYSLAGNKASRVD